jgi:hypothetical protein
LHGAIKAARDIRYQFCSFSCGLRITKNAKNAVGPGCVCAALWSAEASALKIRAGGNTFRTQLVSAIGGTSERNKPRVLINKSIRTLGFNCNIMSKAKLPTSQCYLFSEFIFSVNISIKDLLTPSNF